MPDMPDDPFQGKEWDSLVDRALNGLLPMMKESAVVMSFIPTGAADVKIALEIGFAIMLDKPFIAVVVPGTQVPAKVIAIADHIVEWDLTTGNNDDLMARLQPILDSIPRGDDD